MSTTLTVGNLARSDNNCFDASSAPGAQIRPSQQNFRGTARSIGSSNRLNGAASAPVVQAQPPRQGTQATTTSTGFENRFGGAASAPGMQAQPPQQGTRTRCARPATATSAGTIDRFNGAASAPGVQAQPSQQGTQATAPRTGVQNRFDGIASALGMQAQPHQQCIQTRCACPVPSTGTRALEGNLCLQRIGDGTHGDTHGFTLRGTVWSFKSQGDYCGCMQQLIIGDLEFTMTAYCDQPHAEYSFCLKKNGHELYSQRWGSLSYSNSFNNEKSNLEDARQAMHQLAEKEHLSIASAAQQLRAFFLCPGRCGCGRPFETMLGELVKDR